MAKKKKKNSEATPLEYTMGVILLVVIVVVVVRACGAIKRGAEGAENDTTAESTTDSDTSYTLSEPKVKFSIDDRVNFFIDRYNELYSPQITADEVESHEGANHEVTNIDLGEIQLNFGYSEETLNIFCKSTMPLSDDNTVKFKNASKKAVYAFITKDGLDPDIDTDSLIDNLAGDEEHRFKSFTVNGDEWWISYSDGDSYEISCSEKPDGL